MVVMFISQNQMKLATAMLRSHRELTKEHVQPKENIFQLKKKKISTTMVEVQILNEQINPHYFNTVCFIFPM